MNNLTQTLKIYSVKDKLPESNWSKHTTRYSKHCLVWNGFEDPSFALYDRERMMWFTEDELNPEPSNWIDDVQYFAEINFSPYNN